MILKYILLIAMDEEKTEVSGSWPTCKFYARGYCARGAQCYYSHAEPSTAQLVPSLGLWKAALEPLLLCQCANYLNGFCPAGKACPLPHIARAACEVDSQVVSR